MQSVINYEYRMAEGLYTVEAVLDLLDDVPEDDGEFEDIFFPGSDDELGLVEEELEGCESDSDSEEPYEGDDDLDEEGETR